MYKSENAYKTISEVSQILNVPQHVLRFWESRFNQIKPLKRGGGRRYYKPEDVVLLQGIKFLLYNDGYTIRGVQRVLKEQGLKSVLTVGINVSSSDKESIDDSKAAEFSSLTQSESPRSNTKSFEFSEKLSDIKENLLTMKKTLDSSDDD